MDLRTLAGGEGRADVFVAARLEVTRSAAQKLFDAGHVQLGGKVLKASYRLRPGDVLQVTVPPPEPCGIEPSDIPLELLHVDDDVIVLNKPRGLVVHPGSGVHRGTLVNALVHRFAGSLSAIGGVERPGIVHRLDKDTSGVMVVARHDRAHQRLSSQFAYGLVKKEYLALAVGRIERVVDVDQPIARHPTQRKRMAVLPGGRRARTVFTPLQAFSGYTLLLAQPHTGRTHQIRVHLRWLGHPILGDTLYGGRSALLVGQFLHARRLEFSHPRTSERLVFEAPLPGELQAVLDQLT
ncbi:MAG: RluA family pseudouridine synthase [Candidatus Xenobia bacterium]